MTMSQSQGAETREVGKNFRDGEPTRTVVAIRSYPTQRGDLWAALSDAERIPRWFLPISGDLTPGGRYQLEGNAGGEVLRCSAPESLEVSWEFGEQRSWVALHLEEKGQITQLRLTHSSPQDEASEGHWAKYGPGAVGVGWDLTLYGLGLHIASGWEVLDPKEFQTWMVSDPGKVFMRDSADAWRVAHIESGEDPAIAAAMAEHTTEFYTETG